MSKDKPKYDLCKIALAVENGELNREDLQQIFMTKEQRDHIEKVYSTDVKPQKIATILINDWAPVQARFGLEYGDVPAWQIRDCINFYADGTIAKWGLIKLFEIYAEKAAKRKKIVKDSTVDELAAIIASQLQK